MKMTGDKNIDLDTVIEELQPESQHDKLALAAAFNYGYQCAMVKIVKGKK